MSLCGGPYENLPTHVKLYANRNDIDFSNVEQIVPTQEISLSNSTDIIQYPLRASKFSSVHSLVLYFPSSFSRTESLRLFYLGFYGIYTPLTRDPVITIYEAQPNMADHESVKSKEPTHQPLY